MHQRATVRVGIRRPAALVAAAAVVVGALTGVGLANAGPAAASEPASSERAAQFEERFLTSMIDHHGMAVMMAEMCLEKAVNDELIATCESIIASQSAQSEQMQTWLQDWYGVSHEPEMNGNGSMTRLAQLSGADFEIVFMRSMIRHHWAALREAEQCFDKAEHAELLGLCEEIHTAQLAEIEQMQTWLEAWYGAGGGRPVATA